MSPSCTVGRLDQLRHIRAIQDPLLVRGFRNKREATRSEQPRLIRQANTPRISIPH